MRQFFIPGADPADHESVLAEMAAWCSRTLGRTVAVPEPDQRVRSVTFSRAKGESWTAEVGQRLRGEEVDRHGKTTAKLSSSVTVRVIFPGDPFLVVTDAPRTDWTQGWSNPIRVGAGSVNSWWGVTLFDPPSTTESREPDEAAAAGDAG